MHPREQFLVLFEKFFCGGEWVILYTWEVNATVPDFMTAVTPMTATVCKYFAEGIVNAQNAGHTVTLPRALIFFELPEAFSDNQLYVEVNKKVVDYLLEILSEPFIEIRIVREDTVEGEEKADLLVLERSIPLSDMLTMEMEDLCAVLIPFENDFDEETSLICRIKLGWREPPECVQMCTKSFMENLFQDESSKDLTILAGNGAEVKCHQLIFAAHTPAFSAMFKTGMKEAQSKRVEMKENSEEGIRHLVHYLYGLEVAIGDMACDIAFELFETAHKYGLSQLEGSLLKLFLEQDMKWFTPYVVLEMYFYARNLEVLEKLRGHSLSLMASMPTEELRSCDVFKKLDREEAVDVLLKLVDYVCQAMKKLNVEGAQN